jgi:hypothetical protein
LYSEVTPQSPYFSTVQWKILWKTEVKRDKILLFVTDTAPTCLKQLKALKCYTQEWST